MTDTFPSRFNSECACV